ncbi:hypothetical protein [Micromonospora sp. NPDC093277]|uniref:hypothetical protein n=1 Tax=Micromonospora sp. NPDC093277 TaxID=3364291 RepID=UPI00381919A0
MAGTQATARPHNAARVCTILAFVFAVLAIFIVPPLFALVGLVLGIVGATRGDKPLGWYGAAAAVVGGIIGLVIAYAVHHS